MYIVSGATGHTGSVVAKILLEKGLPVRVIVHSEGKGKVLKDLGAEVAVADLQDADALTEALKGGTVFYLMNPPAYQSEDQFAELEKLLAAAKTAIENSTLEKVVALSSVGSQLASGTGNILTTHKLEKMLESLNIPVTFVRAGSFMENWNSGLEQAKTKGFCRAFFSRSIKKFRRSPPKTSDASSPNQCRKRRKVWKLKNLRDFGCRPTKPPKRSAKF